MKLLAHRGDWRGDRDRHNARDAIVAAFENGWGVETDLRDRGGRVVISHDPASQAAWSLEELLELHAVHGPTTTLALNVKADGLALLSTPSLDHHRPDTFVFDMSVPDQLAWHGTGTAVYTRWSDVETVPVLLDRAQGLWLDAMTGDDWWDADAVGAQLHAGRSIAVVSPELHGRPHLPTWRRLRATSWYTSDTVFLCTDHPREAEAYFS